MHSLTKTSQSLNITNGTSTLTSTFTLSSDGETVNLSEQSENISCNTNYSLNGSSCEANTYTVTLNKDGGSGGVSSVDVSNGDSMPSITVPTKDSCTFEGYFSSTDGSGTQYYTSAGSSARTYGLTSNTTLYASWECEFTFSCNGHNFYVLDENNGNPDCISAGLAFYDRGNASQSCPSGLNPANPSYLSGKLTRECVENWVDSMGNNFNNSCYSYGVYDSGWLRFSNADDGRYMRSDNDGVSWEYSSLDRALPSICY